MPQSFDEESFLRDHIEKYEALGHDPEEARRLAEAQLPGAIRQWEASEVGRLAGR